jgi:hypothetical protein
MKINRYITKNLTSNCLCGKGETGHYVKVNDLSTMSTKKPQQNPSRLDLWIVAARSTTAPCKCVVVGILCALRVSEFVSLQQQQFCVPPLFHPSTSHGRCLVSRH